MKLSDNTSVSMPMRNLISIIGASLIGAWFGFGVIERLNIIETELQLMQKDVLEASTQKPIDQEQFMMLEYLGKRFEQLEKDLKDLPKDRSQDLTIDFFEDRILKLEDTVEDLKDEVRKNGNH